MTGLNLETFLHLLRADFGAWATLGLIALILALMAWTSWGARRALRKCLLLSVLAHFGLALYGGARPLLVLTTRPDEDARPERIRQIQVIPSPAPSAAGEEATRRVQGVGAPALWDRPLGGLALADTRLSAPKATPAPDVPIRPGARTGLEPADASPETPNHSPASPESRPSAPAATDTTPAPPQASTVGEDDVPTALVAPRPEPPPPGMPVPRLRPDRTRPGPASGLPVRRHPSSALTTLPGVESPTPATGPAGSPGPITPRPDESRAVTGLGEPTPPGSVEAGPNDLATVEVTPARAGAARPSVGEADLRTRTRPDARPGRTAPPRPRPPLMTALRPGPALELSAPAPVALAVRPDAPGLAPDDLEVGPGHPGVENRPTAHVEGDVAAAEVVKTPAAPLPRVAPAGGDIRRRSRPPAGSAVAADPVSTRRPPAPQPPLALARVTPAGVPALPEIRGATGGRPLTDVPEVYRSRLDPNRSAVAYRAGASPASEQAVERALDWLARHQDIDGRWDGGTAKYDDGTPVKGDDDFTVHCPPGETCFGECAYWEADTALTGLALLSYLGAGYTQTDGKYAGTVSRGIDFLLAGQKPDGDLRGKSRAVGIYCHAMATIALCEAYALTGDERLRDPVGRAVAFLVRARAKDNLAWRYAPGAPVGDTSILGWVVMALKSAREVGIAVPAGTQAGVLTWLSKVASGEAKGLARYQPADDVTPTMTAEAWACRQFLGVGGPGAASSEAARYLLAHGPKSDTYNLYYWYYGTLAMYQNGGDAWYRWNAEVRDEITRRQVVRGHAAGSWAPDESPYGAKGGRIYCTALATLSLEVYYRYLRLYDAPKIPPAVAPRPRRDRDSALGRLVNPEPARHGNAAGGPKR